MKNLVGRKRELAAFKTTINSGKSEFVAVYGRRRVGKTFLVRSAFNQKFTFQVSGLGNATMTQQLANFYMELQNHDEAWSDNIADNWQKAFQQLITYLEKSRDKRKTIFIDELPWFDTPKSGFIQALEHFWNRWVSARDDIILIVCGSAASWMINKLINSQGGLHNRVTKKIKLQPFNLQECEEFLKSKKTLLDRYQIIQLYMAFGGIPYYWDQINPGKSAMQNIEDICFSKNGMLREEFSNLFRSLFKNHERHLKLLNVIAKKTKGLTRDEIISESGLANAGSTTRLLEELEESGFILKYLPFGKKLRNSLYQLTDFYTIFYLKFIKDSPPLDENIWITMIDSPTYRAWSGYAFEQVCLYHLQQIKQALGISGVQTWTSSWRSTTEGVGAQVDLVIDRRDHVINLCEMKFSINPFNIDKHYAEELRNKIGIFKSETGTTKSVFLTMVTTFGLKENSYSSGIVQNDLKMDVLFKE